MNPKAGEWWAPQYKDARGELATINEFRSSECPVTAIDAETEALLSMVRGAKMAQRATGASFYGPNLSRYPAWLYDAFVVVEAAEGTVERAMMGK